jgi:hypothetical protein
MHISPCTETILRLNHQSPAKVVRQIRQTNKPVKTTQTKTQHQDQEQIRTRIILVQHTTVASEHSPSQPLGRLSLTRQLSRSDMQPDNDPSPRPPPSAIRTPDSQQQRPEQLVSRPETHQNLIHPDKERVPLIRNARRHRHNTQNIPFHARSNPDPLASP